MKKFKVGLAITLLVCMVFGGSYLVYFFAKKSEVAKVVTTIFPIYDICRVVMGDDSELMLLEDTGADMHNYQPTASDIRSVSSSELFIYVGGESDEWVDSVITSANNVNLKTLKLLDDIEGLEENNDNILEGEEEHHHDDEVYDEHIWLSVKNAIIITNSIVDSLSLVYPEKQELFKVNGNEYIEKLEALDKEYISACSNRDKSIVIADRFPFAYLTKDYNIKYHACFSGCSSESEASTETIATLISKVNELDINYILVLETSDQSIARRIITDSSCKRGVQILVVNSCQSVSIKDLQKISYLEIMEDNLENFSKALNS